MHLAESSSTLLCLWTGLSLPVALHLASQRRSYLQLRTGQCSRPERTFTLLLVRTFRRTLHGPSCPSTVETGGAPHWAQARPGLTLLLRSGQIGSDSLTTYADSPIPRTTDS